MKTKGFDDEKIMRGRKIIFLSFRIGRCLGVSNIRWWDNGMMGMVTVRR